MLVKGMRQEEHFEFQIGLHSEILPQNKKHNSFFITFFLLHNHFSHTFKNVYRCFAYVYVCAPSACLVPVKAKRGHWILPQEAGT